MRIFVRITLTALAVAGGLLLLRAVFPISTYEIRPSKELAHLRTLYLGIKMYCGDHEGAYPPDLQTLFENNGPLHTFGKKLREDEDFLNSPRLHYHRPPSSANEETAPLNPETVLLSYDHETHYLFVKADGSGKMERKSAGRR